MKLANSVRSAVAVGVASVAILAGGGNANAASLYQTSWQPYGFNNSTDCNRAGRQWLWRWDWVYRSDTGWQYKYVTGWSCQGSGGRYLYLWA